MVFLGWYSFIILIIGTGILIGIVNDKATTSKPSGINRLLLLVIQLPIIFYMAKTLNLF
ncbi:hypothetical protein [Clostridium sp.]|uniref:hypothetical protein n=1 Tax=Clostridium sp. TaxID=1506 RepID=UPI00261B8F52|nr:hypothetical protein [Clostridium sp.]